MVIVVLLLNWLVLEYFKNKWIVFELMYVFDNCSIFLIELCWVSVIFLILNILKNVREKVVLNKWFLYNDFVKLGKVFNILFNIEYVMGFLIFCVGFCCLKFVNIFWIIKVLIVLWYLCNCKKKFRFVKYDLVVE